MPKPAVSIGLPVFNGAVYLRQALNSLLAQTFENFELIVGDNASSDETESICREYAARDSRIRYFRHSENIGAVKNYMFVFEQSRGMFFMWAAHDDLWDRDWIERLLEITSAETGVMAYGHVHTIDDAGISMKHPANRRSFRFDQKRAWLRRLMYFVQYEGLGKANPIYGLYWASDVARGFGVLSGPSRYADCLFLFHLLAVIRLKSVAQTGHYKRVLSAVSGRTIQARASGISEKHAVLTKLVTRLRNLVNWEVTRGYIAHSVKGERLLMWMAVPFKILFSGYGLILCRRHFAK